MCILFLYNGSKDFDSDYSLILVSNRDELYDRPTMNLAPWEEDPHVIGGRDLQAGCDGGTWLALSPARKKIGVLLNLPDTPKNAKTRKKIGVVLLNLPDTPNKNAETRGRIVADYVKSETSVNQYVDCMRDYFSQCGQFVMVFVEFQGGTPHIQTFNNVTEKLQSWPDNCQGFGNHLPDSPLQKVKAGKQTLADICGRLNKVNVKKQLVEELVEFLKSKERHLPDPQLEQRQREMLSSIFVAIPEKRYGTRTHTIMLVTKNGHMDVVELTMKSPVDSANPQWNRTELHFDL